MTEYAKGIKVHESFCINKMIVKISSKTIKVKAHKHICSEEQFKKIWDEKTILNATETNGLEEKHKFKYRATGGETLWTCASYYLDARFIMISLSKHGVLLNGIHF